MCWSKIRIRRSSLRNPQYRQCIDACRYRCLFVGISCCFSGSTSLLDVLKRMKCNSAHQRRSQPTGDNGCNIRVWRCASAHWRLCHTAECPNCGGSASQHLRDTGIPPSRLHARYCVFLLHRKPHQCQARHIGRKKTVVYVPYFMSKRVFYLKFARCV